MTSSSSEAVKTKGLVRRKGKKRRSSNQQLILNTKRRKIPKNIFTPAFPTVKKRKKTMISEKKKVNAKKRRVIDDEEKENDSNNRRMDDIVKLKSLVTPQDDSLNTETLPANSVESQSPHSSLDRTRRTPPLETLNSINSQSSVSPNDNPRHGLSPVNSQSSVSPNANPTHSPRRFHTPRYNQLPRGFRNPVRRALWNNNNGYVDPQEEPLPQAEEG